MTTDRRTETCSVVIADDDPNIREALSGLLADCPGFELVGVAENGTDAAALSAEVRPDVAILDVMMPNGGVEAGELVRYASPSTMVVFFTAQADRRTRDRLLEAGATAVFAKGGSINLCAELEALLQERAAR